MRVLSTGNAPPPDRRQGAHHPLTPRQTTIVVFMMNTPCGVSSTSGMRATSASRSWKLRPCSHCGRHPEFMPRGGSDRTRALPTWKRVPKLQILRAELKDMIDGCAQGKGFELSHYR